MKHSSGLYRRDFLRCAGAGILGAGVLGCVSDGRGSGAKQPPREALAPAAPEEVNIRPEALQEAVDFLSKEFEAKTFPGATLVATRGGRKFLERYWGTCAGPERNGIPLDGSVYSMMYSFSKVITATVVVMAQQDGLLDYDAPVSQYIGEFAGGGKEAIKVRHLLTHSAGLSAAPLVPAYDEAGWKNAIAALCAMKVEWEPGSRTAYHGMSGMLLAAEVVRRVSGNTPWNDICQKRLFTPLEAGFTFKTPPPTAPVSLVPPPKKFPCPIDGEHIKHLGHPSAGAFARPDDMLKLLNLHLNQGRWHGKTLIKPETLAEMHRVQFQKEISADLAAQKNPRHEYWGLGWNLRGTTKESWFGFGNVASPQSFGHAGIDTVIGLADPERDVALVFMTSASPGEAANTMRLRNTVTNKVMAAVS